MVGRVRINRRQFLKRGLLGAAVTGGVTGLYAWRFEPHWIRVVRRSMLVADLPQGLIGKTLVQISDLHIGPVVDEAYITGAMRLVSSLGADILAITGDIMTYRGPGQFTAVARVFNHLRPGRLATLAVFGNHDFGPGFNTPAVADQLEAVLSNAGVYVLRNRLEWVDGLQLAGVDDYWSSLFNPEKLMRQVSSDAPAILLCHNPDAADLPVWRNFGFRGWMLCGHTHGGQCRLPLCDPPRIPVTNKRYTAGEFDLGNGRSMYINSGLGYLRRIRFFVRPEVTVFTLQKA